MQQNPALAQQAMAMAGQQAGGGVQPAMPGCLIKTMSVYVHTHTSLRLR